MGIGERHCGCLALVSFYLGDALSWRRLLGDALSWRRFLLAMARLGDACIWRCPTWATPYVDFDLDFVNARVRDGTQAPQS